MAIVTAEKIFVDVDDEINFVVEKIFNAAKERVILVVPQNALIISSQVSIKILAKQMLNTKKLVVLVSEDLFGIKLAKQAGILTTSKVSGVTAELWESAQIAQAKAKSIAQSSKKELLTRRGLLEPEDVAKDDLAAEITAELEANSEVGVRKDNQAKDSDSKQNQTDQTDQADELESEDFETESSGETDELEVTEDETLAVVEAEVRGAIQRVRPQPKMVRVGNLEVFAAGDVGVVESRTTDNMEEEIPNRFGNVFTARPKGGFTGKDLTRYAPKVERVGLLSRLFKRKTKRVTLEELENAETAVQKHPRRKYIIITILSTILLAMAGAVYAMVFQLNSVDVLVTLKTTDVPISQQLTLDVARTEVDATNLILPAVLVEEIDLSSSNQATATGQGKTGTKASGSIEVWNFDTVNDYNLPAATRIVNKATGRAYLTKAAVSIPKGVTQNNVTDPGGRDVGVNMEAEQVGAEYNIEISGTSDIPEFTISNYAESTLIGKGVDGAITGGTTETFITPTAEDVEKLKKALVEDLTRQGAIRLQAKVASGYRLIVGTEVFTAAETKATPAVGEKTTNDFTLSVSGKINALAVKESDLRQAIEKLVLANQTNPEGFEVSGLDNAVFAEVKRSANVAQFKVTSAGSLRSKTDAEAIKKSIQGKSVTDARDYLKNNADISSFTLRFNLGFLPEGLQKVPTDTVRISVRIQN